VSPAPLLPEAAASETSTPEGTPKKARKKGFLSTLFGSNDE
jgi:hypothetical protein